VADEHTGGLSAGGKGAVNAILFANYGMIAMDVYSATNSSPWTAESFGGDEAKVASLREYVRHAMIISTIYGVGGAVLAHSLWPVIGLAIAASYMYWLYDRAVTRGRRAGSKSWADAGDHSAHDGATVHDIYPPGNPSLSTWRQAA